jgi:hypothetical protein
MSDTPTAKWPSDVAAAMEQAAPMRLHAGNTAGALLGAREAEPRRVERAVANAPPRPLGV